jgi:hypothetical protein
MSINNIENIAFNYLTNLTTINADEVNTDILTKVDPDISDLQFDMLEGIRTNETIQQQIDSIETQISNIGASYWLSAWDTTTQTNPVANTPRPMTWNSSDPASSGIVAGPVTGSIKVLNTNTYNIQFSVEVKSNNSSTSEITIWLRKNGTDVATTASEYDIKGNDFYTIGWNFVVPLVANDYVQLMWASGDTSMTLYHQTAQTSPYTHPAIPSVIITVTNVTGEGAQGPQGPAGPTGPQGERGPRGYKGEAGDGTVDETARALAGTALALATTAQATAILAQSTASGAVVVNAAQDITISSQGGRINTLEIKTQGIQYRPANEGPPAVAEFTEVSMNLQIPRSTTISDPPAVRLGNNSASFFNYGITSSDLITTTDRFQSTSGTSYFNALEVGNTSTLTDTVFIGRTNNASHKKLVLYDNNVVNAFDYKGIWVNTSGTPSSTTDGFNFENTKDSAYHWYFGDGFGTARFMTKKLTLTNETTYTASSTFLKEATYTQQINMVRDRPADNVAIEFLGDSSGFNTYDGRIIQGKGNGFDNNYGTMTIQSGSLVLDALQGGINMTANNAPMNITIDDAINISATSVLGTITLSTDTADIVSTSAGKTTITATNGDLELKSLNAAKDIKLSSSRDISLFSSRDLDFLTSGGNVRLVSTNNTKDFTAQSARNVFLTAANQLYLTSQNTGVVNSVTISTAGDGTGADLTLNNTSTSNFRVRCPDNLRIETGATTGLELSAGTGGILLSSGQLITLNAVSDIEITSSANDINLTASDIRYTSTTGAVSMTSKSGGGLTTQTGTLSLISLAGDLTTDAYGSNVMDGGSIVITSASTSQLTSTSNTTITSSTGNVALSATSGNISLESSNDLTLIGVNTNITGSTAINLKNQIYFDRTPNAGQYTTSSNAIGYTNSINTGTSYSGTAADSATIPAQVATFTIPNRGAYLIQFDCELLLNTGSDTIQKKGIYLSETTASTTPCAAGFQMYEELDDVASTLGLRQIYSFCGVYHLTATATKALYINVLAQTSGTRTVTASGNIKYTRIA